MQNPMEIVFAGFLLIVPTYTLYRRFQLKKADGSFYGIGQRAISLLALLVLVPTIAILALENALPKDAVVTLFGAIVGYSLTRLTKDSG